MYVDETWDGTPAGASYILARLNAYNIGANYHERWSSKTRPLNPERARFEERPRIVVNTPIGPMAIFKGQTVTLNLEGVLHVTGRVQE